MQQAQQQLQKKRGSLLLKRAFDLLVSTVSIVVLSPVLLIIALAIKLDSPGPVFYRQQRIGRNGAPFAILKFRTMVVDADRLGLLTIGRDARITRVGRFLRKTKLDELAQLFNVFIGEMSLVGPRPEVPKYVALYTDEQRAVLALKPGITDLASIRYRDENALLGQSTDPERVYIDEVMPAKLAINLDYLAHFSFWGDIGLLFATVGALLGDARQKK